MKTSPGKRIAVFLPNWVGDVVLATPALRAIRKRFCDSFIGFVLKPYVADLIDGSNWADELFMRPAGKRRRSVGHFLDLSRRLREADFDTAVLLTNSFRSALLAKLAGIKRRIGYARDGRMLLLTDHLLPDKHKGKFLPVSMRDYYLSVAKYMGCDPRRLDLELFTTEADEHELDRLFQEASVEPEQPLVVINPGAAFGPAKCWLPQRFAEVSDRLTGAFGARTIISCGPRELEIARHVLEHAHQPIHLWDPRVLPLRLLKTLVRRSSLLITNDAGPRHFAIAFGVPVVTIFGPTDPAWTETHYPFERQVMVEVDCGPCMKRTCPLNEDRHRCMTRISVEMVYQAAAELLALDLVTAGGRDKDP